jgi:hypothetical protein
MGTPSPNLNIKDVSASFFRQTKAPLPGGVFFCTCANAFGRFDSQADTYILMQKSGTLFSGDLQFTTKTVPFATDFPVSGKSVLYLGQSR